MLSQHVLQIVCSSILAGFKRRDRRVENKGVQSTTAGTTVKGIDSDDLACVFERQSQGQIHT